MTTTSECCKNCVCCEFVGKSEHSKLPHAETCREAFNCPCHSPVKANYIDSRTPEERAQDVELQKTAVLTTSSPVKEEKIRKGAVDFANRFEGVMKDLAEEEGWEKEFDERFVSKVTGAIKLGSQFHERTAEVKSFISQALSKARSEEASRCAEHEKITRRQTLQEILEKIGKITHVVSKLEVKKGEFTISFTNLPSDTKTMHIYSEDLATHITKLLSDK